jgi:molybdenum cofactor biosynthesis enzyme MoaA
MRLLPDGDEWRGLCGASVRRLSADGADLVGLGITKIRLTGGEPLLRKGIVEFVRDLAKLRTVDGRKPEIALTTNGHLLAEIARR